MGRRNQKQTKNKNKSKDSGDKPKSKGFNPELLLAQAFEGFQELQKCDEYLFEEVDKWWLDWQEYIGINALWDNEDPRGQQYFGKSRPKDANSGFFKKDTRSFHKYSPTMKESIYYNTFLSNNFREEQVRMVDEKMWLWLKNLYPDLVEIPRAQIMVEDYLQYAIELDHVWFGMFDQDTINNFKTGNKKDNFDHYDFYKIQIAKCLNFEMLEDLWIRFYLNRKYGNEEKRNKLKFRIWKMDQTLHIQQIINIMNMEMKEETYRIKGQVFTKADTKGTKVKHFTNYHYKFLLEVAEQDKDWLLKEHPMKKIGQLCQKEGGKLKGLCEQCQEDSFLIVQCLCKENYYCSKECLYKNKKFHSNLCEQAYDSESDDEFEKKKVETNNEAGLFNLGNTCYMNSALQCIFATQRVSKFFQTNEYKEYLQEENKEEGQDVKLTQKFAKLIKEVKSKKQSSIEPWAFKIQFGNYFYMFKNFNQHDSQEFIQNLLEIFNEQQVPALKSESEGDVEGSEENGIEYDNSLSKEENNAVQFLKSLQQNMYSKLFSETFLGVLKSKLSCTKCGKSSVSFEQFSTLALPIAEKKKEVTANIYYVPYNIQDEIKQVKFNLPNDSKITVQEIIIKVVEQLGLPKDSISSSMFAIVSNENVKQEFFDKNCTKKAIEMIKECSQTVNKFVAIYQLPNQYEFYTEENKIISINFKKQVPNKDNKEAGRVVFSIPRIIVADVQEIVADIYLKVAELLENILPEAAEIIRNEIEKEDVQSDEETLKKLTKSLNFEILINSEKQRRKKLPDICLFCQQTSCKSCPLPFLQDKQLQQFTQNYNKEDLSFSVLFDNEEIIKRIPHFQFTQNDSNKNDQNNPSLIDCLKLNQEKEILDEDNMWDCDICNQKQIACKEVTIYYGPRYLVFQIKRFKTNAKGEKVKNNVQVNYGEVEDLTDYIYKINPVVKQNLKEGQNTRLLYRLYGAVIHSGQLDQGHYTSYTYQNNKWTYYNDDQYKVVDASEVTNNRNAYLIFYELIEQ